MALPLQPPIGRRGLRPAVATASWPAPGAAPVPWASAIGRAYAAEGIIALPFPAARVLHIGASAGRGERDEAFRLADVSAVVLITAVSRWVGIIAAALAAISAIFVMPYYPVWSLIYIALAVMVIYGLSAHYGEQAA